MPDEPGARPLVLLRSRAIGDAIDVARCDWADLVLDRYPTLLAAVRGGPQGFTPVVVDLGDDASLAWIPVGALDVAPPPRLYAKNEKERAPDYHDVVFEEPPIHIARIGSWEIGLLADGVVVMFMVVAVGVLASAALLVVASTVPGADERVGDWIEVVPAATTLAWIFAYALARQPLSSDEPLLAPRRRTRVRGRRFWMNHLSNRRGRLERFVERDAPEPFMQDAHRATHRPSRASTRPTRRPCCAHGRARRGSSRARRAAGAGGRSG